MSDLCVFTRGDDLTLLRQSCEHVMITLQTFDCKWTDYVDVKLRKAIDFINTRPEPFMMWVDGHDSLVLKPEDEILARLSAAGNTVMISGETNCYPDADRAKDYHKKHNNHYLITNQPAYICAGCWIGPKHQLLTTLHTVLGCAKDGDDQRAWTTAYLADMLPDVQIDHARRSFASVGDGQTALNSDACIKHWNGRCPGRQDYYNLLYNLVEGTGFYGRGLE